MPDDSTNTKPTVKPTPVIKPKPAVASQMATKPGVSGGKTEEEKWLSSKISEIKSEVEKEIKVVYQSLQELEEVHSILMQQIIRRMEKKKEAGSVSQETHDLMSSEYYKMVYENVEKLVGHIDRGTESLVQNIGQLLKNGLNEILSNFKKT